jgi:hypothetical protein
LGFDDGSNLRGTKKRENMRKPEKKIYTLKRDVPRGPLQL